MDNGCDVTVTKIDNGEQQAVFNDIYVSKSFQIRETGTFRWTANDPGCLVIQRSGAGKTALPFAHDSGGDTDAFDAGGPVAIEVVNFNGNSECKFVLHDASDGRQLDFGSVPKGGGPLSLTRLDVPRSMSPTRTAVHAYLPDNAAAHIARRRRPRRVMHQLLPRRRGRAWSGRSLPA